MACESKRISELPGVTKVYPNDLIPIVQDGTNKYITAKDLLGCHDHSGDDCCCSQALSKAITALDFSRTAMDLANKAYDKACLIGTKLAALEEKVAEHDTLICNIRSLITLIFNKFEELEGNLKVTIQLSIDDQNKKYKVLQGTREVETILVPRPTTDFENGDGKPADAAEVLRRLRNLKGEVSKNLNFVAGKFTLNGESYNGTTEKTLNIPTRTSHLINDGDPDGNPFLTGVKGYDGRTAPVTDGIADLSRIPIKLDDLNDVDAANPQAGDILYYDGTKWVNTPLQDLVESIIDCDYIQNCVSNFKVTPKTHNKTATETTAEYTVEATGAWTVAKESGDFITNFTPSGNGNGTITVTFGNNTTPNTRTAQFLVTETATGRLARVTINQSGVTPTVDRTITYNISGGLTNSIKVNNEAVSNGGQKTAPDGSNYTVSIVSNDPGYRIANVTPSAGTYNNGTLTINPITSDVTVEVILEEIPAGLVTITYTGDIDKVDSGLPSGNVETVALGSHYTNTITPINGYQFDSITVSPSGTSDPTTGGIEISSVTDTTTINIVASEVLSGPNIFEDVDEFNNTEFNAFGVVEERFIKENIAVPITPGVSDPYIASTYSLDASMFYLVDLGRWLDISNDIESTVFDRVGVSLTRETSQQYSNAASMTPAQALIDYLKNSTLVQARLANIKNYTSLIYYSDTLVSDYMTPIPNGIIPAEYGLKQGASNDFPFYIVIAEDTDSITGANNLWDIHVYVLLWCMPTDFNVTHSDDEVELAYYRRNTGSPNYVNQLYGVLWYYEDSNDSSINYKMENYMSGLVREAYKLSPLYNSQMNFDEGFDNQNCGGIVYGGGRFIYPITNGTTYNNLDISVMDNPPVAAFAKTNAYFSTDLPDYNVTVTDNGSPVSGITTQILSEGQYKLEISNFPQTNHLYTITIEAVSTGNHPSLTWTRDAWISDSGNIQLPTVTGASKIAERYNSHGGYGDSNGVYGWDSIAWSGSTSDFTRVGAGYAVRVTSTGVSSITVDGNSITIHDGTSAPDYQAFLYNVFSNAGCPKPPVAIKAIIDGLELIEIYVPHANQTTTIVCS